MLKLDIRTLTLLACFVSVIIGLIMVTVYRTRKTYPGFGWWVCSAFLFMSGTLLLSLRGILPDYVTIIIANTLVTLSWAALPLGILLFFGREVRWPLFFWPVMLVIIAAIYFTYASPNVSMRIIVVTLVASFFFFLSAHYVYSMTHQSMTGRGTLLLVPLLLQALFALFRGLYTMLFETGIQHFMSSSFVQALTFLFLIGGNIAIYVGLFIINSQKIEFELREANAAIKTLQGIVPICMHCKQIRDDKGYWNQLEAYISTHTEAQFSHSICNGCLEKFYPDIMDD